MIDVNALLKQAVQMYSALEGLRQETEDAWQKLAKLLTKVIESSNETKIHIKKSEAVMSQ